MRKSILLPTLRILLALIFSALVSCNEITIEVPPCRDDASEALRVAFAKAAEYGGKPVTIKLSPADYHISRSSSTPMIYHISNTASIEENPDQTKHIGLFLKNLHNVTLDGNGARFVTHGEMTSFVIDSCSNIKLKNFSITSADPSVAEIKIIDNDSCSIVFEVTPPTQFNIENGKFYFKGEGWTLNDGYAQIFDPLRNVTLRCNSPLSDNIGAEHAGDSFVRMKYNNAPLVKPGEIYQIRHGIRNEVCGFINRSKDIELSNIDFNFLGNFGIVGQFSENLTYDNIRCKPSEESARTNAGFADFVQMSSCKGKIVIRNSHFEGAQDDPINIHGTHLRAVASDSPNRLTVRYCHHQTYGFQPFYESDSVEIVDLHTLNSIYDAKVTHIRTVNDYDYEITLDKDLPEADLEDIAVENISWTPEVEIVNNLFARTPTRGILLTTRRRSLIEGNTFFRIPMSAILVSDDARSWYESGPVHDLTIKNNTFYECNAPVICISPETDRFDKAVHKNIIIENNKFLLNDAPAIFLKACDNIVIKDNVFECQSPASEIIIEENASNISKSNNQFISSE